MPQKASKAQAALQLKQKLECDRLVVFGDGSISQKISISKSTVL
ncbi:MAG: hypothetical protein ACLURP_13825 [Ruminococcus sp.]